MSYSDIVSDGGMDPRNAADAATQAEVRKAAAPPVAQPSVTLTYEQYYEIGQRHWLPSNTVEQIHAELVKAAAKGQA
jgi:hypothetical protein